MTASRPPATPVLAAATLATLVGLTACVTMPPPPDPPVPGARNVDALIEPAEEHFAHLWQLTSGGENAEAYWSFAGDRLSLQIRRPDQGIDCDRIFVTEPDGNFRQVSSGRGVTTCAYFLPGDEELLFASTHTFHQTCPPPPDRSQGYVWALYPEYDIYVQDLASGEQRTLVDGYGYDAEATISPLGDRIVFTSTRSGDVDLWTCDLDGSNLVQVTDAAGYDGGAFYSHDGQRLVFRTTTFTRDNREAELADYRRLLDRWLVRPSHMEIMTIAVDGSDRFQVTQLGKANFAPYYFPDDSRIIFSSNHHDEGTPALNFDLFAIDVNGRRLERITHYDGGRGKQFDSFPMFSPDGRYLVFSSNRGDGPPGETNVFIAEWR